VIIGSLYNGADMPPYALPANKTRSTIKTRSTPGGTPSEGNELRFEDKKAAEEVFLHAQKDLNLSVVHDTSLGVGHDTTIDTINDLVLSAHHDTTIRTTNDLVISGGRDTTFTTARALGITAGSAMAITSPSLTLSASQGIGIGTAGDPAVALRVNGTVAATSFQGSGSALTALSAAALAGTINDAQLSTNVARLNAAQTFSGANVFLGPVGIGRTNPSAPLEVAGGARFLGGIRTGSETGASPPTYPTGSDGLIIRRISSTSSVSNNVVARTDALLLIRDGTSSGLTLVWSAASAAQSITGTGVDRNGAAVIYRNAYSGGSGRSAIFADSQRVVHYDISFGNPYNDGHTCHVVLDRYDDGSISDNYLVGTLTSTYNQ
jgi:hypothetical protein